MFFPMFCNLIHSCDIQAYAHDSHIHTKYEKQKNEIPKFENSRLGMLLRKMLKEMSKLWGNNAKKRIHFDDHNFHKKID